MKSVHQKRLRKLLKELADVLYVTYGYALTFGFDLDEAFRRVHASNMSKVDANGYPIVRSDGKIMKGDNYREPDLSDLVRKCSATPVKPN